MLNGIQIARLPGSRSFSTKMAQKLLLHSWSQPDKNNIDAMSNINTYTWFS